MFNRTASAINTNSGESNRIAIAATSKSNRRFMRARRRPRPIPLNLRRELIAREFVFGKPARIAPGGFHLPGLVGQSLQFGRRPLGIGVEPDARIRLLEQLRMPPAIVDRHAASRRQSIEELIGRIGLQFRNRHHQRRRDIHGGKHVAHAPWEFSKPSRKFLSKTSSARASAATCSRSTPSPTVRNTKRGSLSAPRTVQSRRFACPRPRPAPAAARVAWPHSWRPQAVRAVPRPPARRGRRRRRRRKLHREAPKGEHTGRGPLRESLGRRLAERRLGRLGVARLDSRPDPRQFLPGPAD